MLTIAGERLTVEDRAKVIGLVQHDRVFLDYFGDFNFKSFARRPWTMRFKPE